VEPALSVAVFAVGAGLLALWVLGRFPTFGPKSLGASLILAAAAFILESPIARWIPSVAESTGVAATLLLVVLPSLTLLFWSTGCVVRSLVLMIAPYRR
jgi:hypothetical protein